jgi:nitrite reductase (NADH) small subunit
MTEVVVGSVDEIPLGEGRTFAVDGSLRAIDAVCPHKAGPLADGLADDRVVVCPLHGYTFDMCTGSEAGGADMTVRSYAVSVDDGAIRIQTK